MKKKAAVGGSAICAIGMMISIILGHGTVRTNQAGLELIGNAEQCRRDPYICPAGKWTDGVGNTHNVKPGVRKTDQQIAADWEKNILIAERCINQHFRGKDMPDNTFSAMTSAAFNMGCGSLLTYYSKVQERRVETSIHKWAQAGNWVNMCNHLPDFINGGGVPLPGLKIRRERERQLCLKGFGNE
ncbi:TPA: lysozyme [Klebsiella aerogenes]|nr:lysozyme [Salmonella enterica subsp. enterica serovar Saintpaul str. CFSAN004147]HCZ5289012.1 lysozyme [Salmonella enterica subsp. enterica serovar Saintpaul str. CFSAN004154]